ncbi:MAG TPA: hypothetical protein VIR02_09360 [Anaerolineales bacterium]
MKTLLSILAHNVQHRAQMVAEAYLRRVVLRPRTHPLGNRRYSFYVPQFRVGLSYFKHGR